MKTLFALTMLALSVVSTGASAQSAPEGAFDFSRPVKSEPIFGVSTRGYLPDCSEVDGQSCEVENAIARCYNYQYQEPFFCRCRNGVFVCYF